MQSCLNIITYLLICSIPPLAICTREQPPYFFCHLSSPFHDVALQNGSDLNIVGCLTFTDFWVNLVLVICNDNFVRNIRFCLYTTLFLRCSIRCSYSNLFPDAHRIAWAKLWIVWGSWIMTSRLLLGSVPSTSLDAILLEAALGMERRSVGGEWWFLRLKGFL